MSTIIRQNAQRLGAQLKAYRDEHGLTQDELSDRLKITRSYLSEIENGHPCSAKLRARFRELEESQSSVGTMSENVQSKYPRVIPDSPEIVRLRLVPLVSWAQAGQAVEYDELPLSWQKRVHTDIDDPKAFAVTIAGDSMEPRHKAGDIAFLEPSRPVRQGDKVIARLRDQGVVFKLYGRAGDSVRFSSYNPAYPPFDIAAADIVWVYPVHSTMTIEYGK